MDPDALYFTPAAELLTEDPMVDEGDDKVVTFVTSVTVIAPSPPGYGIPRSPCVEE